jgi:hypothetical protein
VVDINANEDLTHRVVELRVFGSYLTDAEDLGDLDIAYALEFRYPGKEAVQLSLMRARASGRQLSYLQQLMFGQHEVVRLLRARKARISLHPMDELKELGIAGVAVFPAR